MAACPFEQAGTTTERGLRWLRDHDGAAFDSPADVRFDPSAFQADGSSFFLNKFDPPEQGGPVRGTRDQPRRSL